ncbi:hypothetical protein Tco_1153383 [Tanacetum coccineum]
MDPATLCLIVDESKQGFGSLLSQRGKVIAYAVKTVEESIEKNYTTLFDLELGIELLCDFTNVVWRSNTPGKAIRYIVPQVADCLSRKKDSSQDVYVPMSITYSFWNLRTKILEAQCERFIHGLKAPTGNGSKRITIRHFRQRDDA